MSLHRTFNGFSIERDEKGIPIRLLWSSKDMAEDKMREENRRASDLRAALAYNAPMPAMREWAEKNGVKF